MAGGLAERTDAASAKQLRRLGKSFYARDAISVARDLVGCLFFHRQHEGLVGLRLVETEAYRGAIDPGSHGYGGMTERTRSMFGPPGRLYVYFTYGMHWCVNVVCAKEGVCGAVLLRAGEPACGIELMRRRRGGRADRLLAAGPGRLAQAMGVDKRHDGASLLRGGSFWCAEDEETRRLREREEPARTTRIGLASGRGDELEWRFVLRGHPYASRRH